MVGLRRANSNFIELLTLSQYQMYNVVGIKVLYLDWRPVISIKYGWLPKGMKCPIIVRQSSLMIVGYFLWQSTVRN